MDDSTRAGDGAGCSRIDGGVQRTLAEGSAEVDVALEYSFPGESSGQPETMAMSYRGRIDFRSDRASLLSGNTELILEGAATYQSMPDGVWTHTRQEDRSGRWTCTHPRWALEVLRQGCRRAEPTEPGGSGDQPELAVELDPDRAAALTHPGLNPDWTLRASTAFDDVSRLRRIQVSMAALTSPDAWMRNTVEFTRFDQAPARIDLPEDSVSLTTYLSTAAPGQ